MCGRGVERSSGHEMRGSSDAHAMGSCDAQALEVVAVWSLWFQIQNQSQEVLAEQVVVRHCRHDFVRICGTQSLRQGAIEYMATKITEIKNI